MAMFLSSQLTNSSETGMETVAMGYIREFLIKKK